MFTQYLTSYLEGDLRRGEDSGGILEGEVWWEAKLQGVGGSIL